MNLSDSLVTSLGNGCPLGEGCPYWQGWTDEIGSLTERIITRLKEIEGDIIYEYDYHVVEQLDTETRVLKKVLSWL